MVLLRICVEGFDARLLRNFEIMADERVGSSAIVFRPLPAAPVTAVPSVAAVYPLPSFEPWRYSLLARVSKPLSATVSIAAVAALMPYLSAPIPVGVAAAPTYPRPSSRAR